MPQGKGTYGSKVGRPPKKKTQGRVTETVKKVAKKASVKNTARAAIPGASMIAQGIKAQKSLKKKK